jgi:hypothetical protein
MEKIINASFSKNDVYQLNLFEEKEQTCVLFLINGVRFSVGSYYFPPLALPRLGCDGRLLKQSSQPVKQAPNFLKYLIYMNSLC